MSDQSSYKKETASTEDYKDREFNYWLLFLLTVILIPCTFWLYRKLFPKKEKLVLSCHCAGCKEKENEKIRIQKLALKSTETKIKMGIVAVLYFFFFIMLYTVLSSNHIEKEPYNPYTVLGLSSGAQMDEIKKAYRQLSLTYHPDKCIKSADEEFCNEKYIAISKAYEILTDEGVREKYEKYGNPDGPQAISVGIALPSWLINRSNSPLVLAGYLLLLVGAVPAGVYFWSKRSSKFSEATVLNDTLGFYYHMIDGTCRLKSLIEIIGASLEFKNEIPDRNSDEEALKNLEKHIPVDYKVKKARFNAPYVIKTTKLIYAHISRVHQHLSPNLRDDLTVILKKYRMLLNGAFQIQLSQNKRQIGPLTELVKLSQCMMQSAWDDQSLKQLPHIDHYLISDLKKVYHIPDIVKFKSTEQEKRNEILTKANLSPEQIQDVEYVLAKIPAQIGIKFKITSEDEKILAGSVCTIEIEFTDAFALKKERKEEAAAAAAANSPTPLKAIGGGSKKKAVKPRRGPAPKKRVTSPKLDDSSSSTPTVTTATITEETTTEDSKKDKKKSKKAKDSDSENEDKETNAESDSDDDLSSGDESDSDSDSDWEPVQKKAKPSKDIYHTPFTQDEKPLCYWIFFGNRQKNELIGINKSESYEPGTSVKVQFLTSPEPGVQSYTLYVMCDGYIGCDYETNVNIVCEKNPNPIVLPKPQPPQAKKPAAAAAPKKASIKEEKDD
ncbi:hypothetical protein CYY_001236 [Polysphondylium violaceum]|uniref:J domain-containing protein n=1 Tax=Polysphondylium violaceum TaxID=133409 RepID=A0A8J4PYI1_9MYCE|nr:hypothetical protein CYY_001236 [Polysphondylium violaceum]